LMLERQSSNENKSQDDLEVRMQKISLVVSVLAMGLMIAGFLDMVLRGSQGALPGRSVLQIAFLTHVTQAPADMAAMSAGILLLVLLPTIRVLLATLLYARRRGFLNALVALLVLVELLFSIRGGI
jgi:uncharacterized membrane protein